MTPPPPPAPLVLPRGVRLAAVLCLVFSLLTSYFTLGELGELQLVELGKVTRQPTHPLLAQDPQLAARVGEAQLSAVRSVKDSRGVLLGSLLVAYTLVFVSATRMLRPVGLRLEPLRRLLSGALLSAALLRTVEGAQAAVVAQRMAPALMEVMRARPDISAEELELVRYLPGIALGIVALLTAFVAGTFCVLAQYFRSQGVREALAARDALRAPEEE